MPTSETVSFYVTVVVALIAAYIVIDPELRSQYFSSEKRYKVYCYDDVTTLSKGTPKAKCFSVSEAGSILNIWKNIEDAPTHREIRKGAVIPGLWDGHGHILQLGEALQSVNLFDATSMKETLALVSQYVEKHPDAGSSQKWIRGIGWDQAIYGNMPTAVSHYQIHASLQLISYSYNFGQCAGH
jgi:hypothetical protein